MMIIDSGLLFWATRYVWIQFRLHSKIIMRSRRLHR